MCEKKLDATSCVDTNSVLFTCAPHGLCLQLHPVSETGSSENCLSSPDMSERVEAAVPFQTFLLMRTTNSALCSHSHRATPTCGAGTQAFFIFSYIWPCSWETIHAQLLWYQQWWSISVPGKTNNNNLPLSTCVYEHKAPVSSWCNRLNVVLSNTFKLFNRNKQGLRGPAVFILPLNCAVYSAGRFI